ncbi:MAG: DUF4351 domain-containing protein [Trichodesmium sp. MAG_R04]|nr:DUF4351 domain-containing protein [Trichodesmium sp. MAG_R04]
MECREGKVGEWKIGEVFVGRNTQIEVLPLEDVEGLVKVFLSFNRMADLESCLQEPLSGEILL